MRKKVLFFTESLYGGGVPRILQIILSHFDYSKYDVTLYSLCRNNYREEIYPKNIAYRYIFDVPERYSSRVGKLLCRIKNKILLLVYYHSSPSLFYKIFIREKTDVAIAFIEGYATRLVYGFPDSIKRIAWLHTDIENNHWSRVAYRNEEEEKSIYRNYSRVICVSEIVRAKLYNYSGYNDNIYVITNPIDRQFVIDSSLRDSYGTKLPVDGSIKVLSMGALIDVKGYGRLLSVAKHLHDDGYSFRLYILGDGNKKGDLISFVDNNNLSSCVYLLGYHENPFPFLRQADVYVCASYAEGYNTAIVEALILGKAVVSTECSGVKEQLGENNEWGICVPNSEVGLYDGIKRMLNPEVLSYYSSKAAIRGNDFTLDKSMDNIYKLIET